MKILDKSGVNEEGAGETGAERGDDDDERSNEDFDKDDYFVLIIEDHGQTFEKAFNNNIDLITEFLASLKFQAVIRARGGYTEY